MKGSLARILQRITNKQHNSEAQRKYGLGIKGEITYHYSLFTFVVMVKLNMNTSVILFLNSAYIGLA